MIKLIILDRDGVINFDSPDYIKSPDEWQAVPGSLAAIAKINHAGINVCVATNQSGIARGYYSLSTLSDIHDKMCRELKAVGGHLDAIFFCPHGPDDHCNCRKPQPGLYQQALDYFKVEAAEALVIGDSARDIEAAHTLGCQAMLVKSNKDVAEILTTPGFENTPVYDDLTAAIEGGFVRFWAAKPGEAA